MVPQREMERERAVTFVGLFPIIDLARYVLESGRNSVRTQMTACFGNILSNNVSQGCWPKESGGGGGSGG